MRQGGGGKENREVNKNKSGEVGVSRAGGGDGSVCGHARQGEGKGSGYAGGAGGSSVG